MTKLANFARKFHKKCVNVTLKHKKYNSTYPESITLSLWHLVTRTDILLKEINKIDARRVEQEAKQKDWVIEANETLFG